MKTIGLIGGLTWLSSMDYYRLLNEMVNKKLGGVSSAKIILYSVEFGEIKLLTESGQWDKIETIIIDAAKKLELCGADCILLGANTMHKIAPAVQASIKIPVIHIAEEVAKEIKKSNLKKVALLGTKYTMLLDFYKTILADNGIETIIPGGEDINYINTAIYSEMGKGQFLASTKEKFLSIVKSLEEQGAEGVILGCTEIPILIKQDDVAITAFDTTTIHAKAAVDFALN